jgi:hypothetical protein
LTFVNGDVYDGEWKDDKKYGKGAGLAWWRDGEASGAVTGLVRAVAALPTS